MRRLEPDIEALLEAEQLAMRPGPRPKSRPFVLEELRNAIKGVRTVNIKYRNRSTRRINRPDRAGPDPGNVQWRAA